MGIVLHVIDHDFAGAEAAYRQAIKLDPNNATAMGNLGYLLTSAGRFGEAEGYYRRAVEIEPASATLNRSLGAFFMFARRYDESVAHLKKTIDLEPNFILGHLTLANTFLVQGRYGEAVESYTEARRLIGYDPAVVTTMQESYAKGGWREFILSMDRGTWPELYRPSYIKGVHFASIGDKDQAFAQLEKAYGERDGFITLIKVDPRLDSLRDDPRYAALVKKVGL